MMTDRNTKIGIISLSVFITLFSLFVLAKTGFRLPWDYGFFAPAKVSKHPSSTGAYVHGQQSRSLIYLLFLDIVQSILGVKYKWVRFPGIFVLITVLFPVLPRKSPILIRLGAITAALSPPFAAYPLLYSLRRDLIELVFIATAILLVIILIRLGRRGVGLVLIACSIAIWHLHYTAWPFFVVFSSFFIIINRGRVSIINLPLIGLAPIIFLTTPLQTLLSYGIGVGTIVAGILTGRLSLSAISQLGRSQLNNGIILGYTLHPRVPEWVNPVVLVGTAIGVSALIVILVSNLTENSNWRSKLSVLLRNTLGATFFSASVAFAITAVLVSLVGFVGRIFLFWPLLILLVCGTIFHYIKWNPNSSTCPRHTILLIFAFMVVVTSGPIITTGYMSPEQSPSRPTGGQIAGAHFAIDHVPSDTDITTDMIHANSILIRDDQHVVYVGRVKNEKDKIMADQKVSALFHPKQSETEIIVATTTGRRAIAVWGGAIPPASDLENKEGINIIYDNRADVIVWQ